MWGMKTALVGDDGSERARGAVQWARALAGATGVELVVVGVTGQDDRSVIDERSADLEQRVGRPAREDGLACTCRVVVGEPRQTLVDEATDVDADLVIVGDTGHWGLVRPPIGSVAAYLAHHSPCPLVVVPGPGGPLEQGRIVVGVDGSENSRASLRWAAATAALMRGSVVAVFLYDPLADSYPHPPQASEWHQRLEGEVRSMVDAVREPDVDVELRIFGANPVEGLLEVAGEVDAPLVVVGSRGHGGFRRLLLGGTALELLHHSHRPVVVVPTRSTGA